MTTTPTADRWSGRGWSITLTGAGLRLEASGTTTVVSPEEAAKLAVRRRLFRWYLERDGQPPVRLHTLSGRDAANLRAAVGWFALTPAITEAVAWHARLQRLLDGAAEQQRWITTEEIDELIAARPDKRLAKRVRALGRDPQPDDDLGEALAALDADLFALVEDVNERFTVAELENQRSLFDRIDERPLSEEQARAVICFDNRVQVLAAAGSGKTSVMVARAAYAVERGLVPPERILLLAFNKKAAEGLEKRITKRFAAAGIDSSGVRAATFHRFGLAKIGRATGKKPRLASWVGRDQDEQRVVLEIVDELRDASPGFRYRWDLYRMVFANDPSDPDEHEPDGHEATTEPSYRTFGGEVVKSRGEQRIADFLYLHGVDYRYEHPYAHDVADAEHGQYRPDFYYPAIDVWHEHWSTGRDGNPPAHFVGYAASMDWKLGVHAEYGTTLVESTFAEVMFGDGLTELEDELTRLGLEFDWDPDRPLDGARDKPMAHPDLARLIRTFMTHVKSNAWTAADLEERLNAELRGLAGVRTRLFLEVYWQIHAAWNQRLADHDSIDFEDMLIQAAEHLEAGTARSDYELVLVDEFQDASWARARLVKALVKQPGRFLLTVGDDWQSINRFAGADLSVMTGFEEWFGRGQQLKLTTTFRCTQRICDVARAFVLENDSQIDKPMNSYDREPGAQVTIVQATDPAGALNNYLERLSADVVAGREPVLDGDTLSVKVLGRYKRDHELLPARKFAGLEVAFLTVHGSKGLEADHIVVPRMVTGSYAFPSGMTDDPLLALAMPGAESFPHAEERRLFYVALTRARRSVTLITSLQRMSPFVIELEGHPDVRVVADDGGAPAALCPVCGHGGMVERTGKFGPFLGCSTYPTCRNTVSLP